MKILKARTVETIKWVSISVTHKGKKFNVSVETKDGKVSTSPKSGVYTSYLNYFNTVSVKDRIRHFQQIKMYVEKFIK